MLDAIASRNDPARRRASFRSVPPAAILAMALALTVTEAATESVPSPADEPIVANTLAFRTAEARQQDAATIKSLTAEARILIERDKVKLDGYQYCDIAVAAAERGDFRDSIEASSRALLLGQEQENPDLVAVAKRDLALAYSYAGDLDNAELYARDALASRPKVPAQVYAPASKILGDVALRRGDPGAAIAAYQQALQTASPKFKTLVLISLVNAQIEGGQADAARITFSQATKAGAPAFGPLYRRVEGNLLLAENKPGEAIRAFTTAAKAPAAAGSGGVDNSYDSLWANEGLGRAYLAQNDKTKARQAYRTAVEESERIRARFRSDEFKTGLFSDTQTVFEQAIALAMEGGDFEEAWHLSERSRARALLDVVRNRIGPAPPRSSIDNVDVAKLNGGTSSQEEIRRLLRPDEAIVEFHALDRQLLVWVIRRDGLSGQALPIARKDLDLAVDDFRQAIIKRRRTAMTFGEKLDALLIAPLALRPQERLVIVPHGALHYLPFQALRNQRGWLIERHAIALAPSANIGARLIARDQKVASSLVAFGNPEIAPDYALPAAEREVQNIAPLFTRKQTFFRAAATRAHFRASAQGGRVLHIAAHAEADTVDPLHSRILLAPEAQEGAGPAYVLAKDIYSLQLDNVALVTLSACESGLGRIARGDEILGFTRSFFYAGTSSLIASLWPVADESSELMMTTFYSRLTKGTEANEAMRAAQLAVLNAPEFSHPFFWAPFNLMGNWRLTVAR